jgi:hypothetical protein
MLRKLAVPLVAAALVLSPALLAAQNPDEEDQRNEDAPPSHFAVNLTVNHWGLSFGNSQRLNGLRLNWSDDDIELINGVNITLWKPGSPLTGTVNGLAIGVVGPGARDINGLAIGLGGVVTEHRMRGIALAGLGAVSNGDFGGIGIAGLGVVANRDFTGFGLSGLGVVANGNFGGIGISGLGVVANHDFTGFGLSGLGVVANGDFTGVSIAGLGAVANGTMTGFSVALGGVVGNRGISGITLSGLGVVTNGEYHGIALAGVGVVANRGLTGFAFGGAGVIAKGGTITGGAVSLYRVEARAVRGVSVAGLYLKTWDLTGIGVGAYNRVRRTQVGLTIGLINYARELHGVQIGIINIAKNNKAPFRVLPIVNLNLAGRERGEDER